MRAPKKTSPEASIEQVAAPPAESQVRPVGEVRPIGSRHVAVVDAIGKEHAHLQIRLLDEDGAPGAAVLPSTITNDWRDDVYFDADCVAQSLHVSILQGIVDRLEVRS